MFIVAQFKIAKLCIQPRCPKHVSQLINYAIYVCVYIYIYIYIYTHTHNGVSFSYKEELEITVLRIKKSASE
jgi:hypothetical protein